MDAAQRHQRRPPAVQAPTPRDEVATTGDSYLLFGYLAGLELSRVRRIAVYGFRIKHFFRLRELERFRRTVFADCDLAVEAGSITDVAARAAGNIDA